MEYLGFVRIGLILITTGAMFFIARKFDFLPVKGLRLVWSGIGLLVLHLLVGLLYHNEIISKTWLGEFMPYVGFVTGYIGQTLGLIAIPLGAHTMLKSFSPQLRESLKYHEDFVHSIEGIVYEINAADFRFTFVSDGCKDLLGYSREYWLKNITWEKIILPDDLNHVIEHCSAAIRENRNHTIEFRALTADGRIVWLRDVSTVITTPEQAGKVRGVLMDVTDHVERENELRKSELRYRTLIERMNEGMLQVTNDDTIVFASDRFCEMMGYSSRELVGQVAHKLLVPEEHQHLITEKNKDRKHDVADTYEIPMIRKSGERIWVLISGAPMKGPDGTVVGSIGLLSDITERKRLELENQSAIAQIKSLFENLNEMFFSYDAVRHKLLMISPACERIYGRTQDDFFKNSALWKEIVHPDDKTKVEAHERQLYAGNQVQWEHRILRTDRIVRWVESKVTPSFDDKGVLVRLDGTVSDVTERNLSRQALEVAHSQLHNLHENLEEALFSVDVANNKMLYISPAHKKVFGRLPEDFFKNPNLWYEIIVPEDKLIIDRGYPVLAAGKRLQHQYRILHPNGSVRWIEARIKPTLDASGTLVRLDGIATDISDRKAAETALLESEARYRSLVESARDTILTISPAGFITSLNQAFEVTTKWRRDEWIGRSFTELFHPDDVNTAIDAFSRAISGETDGVEEFRVKTQSGDFIDIEVTSTLQRGQETTTSLLVIARDITARKNLEDNLRQAQKMEGLGTLASGIAHDFNNILGIIMTHASLLEDPTTRDAILEKGVGAINKAVRRGAHLVSQILTLARKTEFSPRALDPNEAVHEVSKMIKDTFPKTIEIVENLDSNLYNIMADSTHVLQCLLNLSVNARDAMDGKGTLTFKTNVVSRNEMARFPNLQSDHYVAMSVTDTGSGIDEKTLQRIFEPFFTTKERGKGTGMGLAMVYGIMQNHGGFVDVESEIGVGTTFRLYFPATKESPQGEEIAAPTLHSLTGSETILIAEDEQMLAELVQALLEGNGYKVHMTHDGQEALDFYTTHRDEIDLVISDLGLPKLNGVDLARKLLELNPDTKIIVASGYFAPEARTELEGRGITEFVSKPYKAGELFEAIRRMAEKPHADISIDSEHT